MLALPSIVPPANLEEKSGSEATILESVTEDLICSNFSPVSEKTGMESEPSPVMSVSESLPLRPPLSLPEAPSEPAPNVFITLPRSMPFSFRS